MKTLTIKINPRNPEKEKIEIAAQILKEGGLVVFPTDTVYGLAADAKNPRAVKKIFKVKKRPLSNPLPILIARKTDLRKYTKETSAKIKRLTDKFWPGPLTLILLKKKNISNIVTAGLPRVGVRVPDNAVALALIQAFGRPLATTSANIAGKPSPATSRGVKKYLNNKIDLILDGGKTKLGQESTVLDCSASPPTFLRSGAIPTKKLKKLISN
ncbi:MAG: L-threonylcarbamoyladenylate synthase [Patescibacteria group bacterium]|jgi:L-threonylcarbamoyladenylate synthase